MSIDFHDRYEKDGYAHLDFTATLDEVAEVRDYIARRIDSQHDGNIYDEAHNPRALHGYDEGSDMLSLLMNKFAEIAKNILHCKHVYVYQFRVNLKHPTKDKKRPTGGWKPHRDFDYWQRLDGMLQPQAVIFHLLVDEHNRRNGPLELCPGSHERELDEDELVIAPESNWKAGFSENIKYQIDARTFAKAKRVTVIGDPGTLLVMHPLLWHASSPNFSNQPRTLLSIVFNDLTNVVDNPDRPSFVVQSPSAGVW